ncbi:MAG: DNA mismatch repair protein MutS [Candidatus Omnitrophica bacterium]|nr:DNA mismatch repair protein MutS [Candidatus Omnitrophota bacterium]
MNSKHMNDFPGTDGKCPDARHSGVNTEAYSSKYAAQENEGITPQMGVLQQSSETTPMLKQYHALKAKHKDCILFFRLGDFYEMFFDDAKEVSRVLDLVLTSRGKGSANHVPMCGFPHHASEGYISRLVKAGYKIAICEQMEDPALAKGIVKRDIIRIITSGTYLDENDDAVRYIMAVWRDKKTYGLAFTDPTNGTIQTQEFPIDDNKLTQLICRLPIYECIFPDHDADHFKALFKSPVLRSKTITLSPYGAWGFNPEISKKTILEHFKILNLHGFGIENKTLCIGAVGGLLQYLKEMNKQPLLHIDRIVQYTDEEFAFISPAAQRGLELDQVVQTIDHTRTALGKRNLWFWFYHPLKNKKLIDERLEAVTTLKNNKNIQTQLKVYLDKIPDLEKNISRLSCGYSHPKDILAIRNTLALIPEIISLIAPLSVQNKLFGLKDITDLRENLIRTINEDIPLAKPDGKVICPEINTELDELKNIQTNGHAWLRKFQEDEIKRSGINSLKVGFNKVFGYYIEITKTNLASVPTHYIRKQTLVNGERYITQELKEYEEKILTAQDKILAIENTIIKEVQQNILAHALLLHDLCQSLATIDAVFSMSVLAQSAGYTLPEISEDTTLAISDGRHPVVEKYLTDTFIANDTLLDREENQLLILTGPNMSGKSTYIRQTAILAILAQTGSYIPAKKAHIGIIDKFFTRIGAHDDISKGQSTFMVEMNEAAGILHNLSERSLVILDEIGRGTSTYDGLSLAWALAEHLKQARVRTLFATHFHELTALAEEHSGVKNYNVSVKEWNDEIIFLHKIVPGSTDDSYGIYVAKLAGIPKSVIERAKKILTSLELKQDLKESLKNARQTEIQMSLFTPTSADPRAKAIIEKLENIDVNNLKPIEALNILNDLKNYIKENGNT